MNKIKPFLGNIYFLYLAFVVFFLPLVFGTTTNELYEFPKMYFLYFTGVPLVVYFLSEKIWKGQKVKAIPFYVLLTVLSVAVSTIFSVHKYTSVWGYYTRFGDGLMSTLVLFGFYLVIREKLNRQELFNLAKIAVFSTFPVSLYAIFQHSEITRVYSTFGQANWLAQFLAVLLLLANLLFLFTNQYVLWFVISVVGFMGLWFTYSLSGILGYFLGFLLLLVLYRRELFFGKTKIPFYKLLLLSFIFEVIAFSNLGVFKLRVLDVVSDVKNFITVLPAPVYAQDAVLQSTTSVTRNLSDPGYIRGGLWEGSLKLWTSSPKTFLVGTGPETYPYVFQPYRPKSLNYSSEWNFVFNKPHNYFIEIAVEQGLLGLLVYLYIIALLFAKSPRKYLPGLLAFVITNFFGWTPVYMSLLFWIFIANLEVLDAQ